MSPSQIIAPPKHLRAEAKTKQARTCTAMTLPALACTMRGWSRIQLPTMVGAIGKRGGALGGGINRVHGLAATTLAATTISGQALATTRGLGPAILGPAHTGLVHTATYGRVAWRMLLFGGHVNPPRPETPNYTKFARKLSRA